MNTHTLTGFVAANGRPNDEVEGEALGMLMQIAFNTHTTPRIVALRLASELPSNGDWINEDTVDQVIEHAGIRRRVETTMGGA